MDEISKDTISKIKYTALLQNCRNLVEIFFSHLPLCKSTTTGCFFARHGDIKQTRRQNMAEIMFSWGVSEIKYIIFIENSDYLMKTTIIILN
jgi:hypothetical protein